MSDYPISLKSFGDQAILIEWPAHVEEDILYDILGYSEFLKTECLDSKNWELIPAYNSLTLVHNKSIDNSSDLIEKLRGWYTGIKSQVPLQRQLWKLPVCYDLEFGIDLTDVAKTLDMSISQLIELHTNNIYTVYGINIWSGIVHYLTFDKWHNVPSWNPAELFVVENNCLPPEWYFMFYGYGDKDIETVSAVWGYKELALSRAHYRELILNESNALEIFSERKKRIDEFHNKIRNDD